MNDHNENDTIKPLRDEQLGAVTGGIGRPGPVPGIKGMFGTLEQRGAAGGFFASLEQRSARPCPGCGRTVSPQNGKCPLCGAIMAAGPAESI